MPDPFSLLPQMLAERTEKVCEMAAVMKEAVRVDEETCNEQQELVVRLVTENRLGFYKLHSEGLNLSGFPMGND